LVKQPEKELESHLTGSATFVEDLVVDDALHLGFLRSPHAHAKIIRIVTGEARKMKGVAGVFTASDFQGMLKPGVWQEYPLASTEVVYEGQPVVAVVTSTKQAMEDCLELVGVKYEPLNVVSRSTSALVGGDMWLSTATSNVVFERQSRAGEPLEALARSPHKLKLFFDIPRISPFPIEGRGEVVERHPSETVVYAPTQSPGQLQNFLTDAVVEPGPIRVIQTAVGGAFGSKFFPHAEELACFLVSSKLRRNVKWIPLPEEKHVVLTHRPNQTHEVQVGFDFEGKVLALIDHVLVDAGAHFEGSAGGSLRRPEGMIERGAGPIEQSAYMIPGPYDIRNVEVNVTAVATNTVMMGPIRGSGGMVATFVLERVMNQIALRLGLDQFLVRRVNLTKDEAPTHRNAFGLRIPNLRFLELLDSARRSKATRDLLGRSFASDDSYLRGMGICFYLAESAPPSAETVRLDLTEDGRLQLFTSVAPSGQGSERTLASIISVELGSRETRVEVHFGDTLTSKAGMGTQFARSITYAGSAAMMACRGLVDQVLHRIKSSPSRPVSVAFEKGTFVLKLMNGKTAHLGFAEVAAQFGAVSVEATYRSETSTYSAGCHLSLVEVEKSTGSIRVLSHVTFDDFGRVLDQSALAAQTDGAVLQAVGETLLESLRYDREGRMRAGYTIPSATAMPTLSHNPLLLTTSQHLHGARGAGEAGRVGAIPAMINALENALFKPGEAGFLAFNPVSSESAYKLMTGK
jgi:aerobic carbon-monoxide dehydrogenase large subunit